MQSAKISGTMPHVLILPPGGETKSKTIKKTELQENQQVTGKITTEKKPRHASCNSHTRREDIENKEE